MPVRNYSSTTPVAALSAGISDVDTSVTLSIADTSFPTVPFTLILDPDTVNEEVVDVTATAGNVYTITRGVDGTTAKAHAINAEAIHGVSGRDFQEANDHINATTSVHGIADTSLLETTSGAQAKADAAAASSVAKSVVTAKGDLIVASGSGAIDELPVGTDDTFLVADSGAALGVKWAALSVSTPDEVATVGSVTPNPLSTIAASGTYYPYGNSQNLLQLSANSTFSQAQRDLAIQAVNERRWIKLGSAGKFLPTGISGLNPITIALRGEWIGTPLADGDSSVDIEFVGDATISTSSPDIGAALPSELGIAVGTVALQKIGITYSGSNIVTKDLVSAGQVSAGDSVLRYLAQPSISAPTFEGAGDVLNVDPVSGGVGINGIGAFSGHLNTIGRSFAFTGLNANRVTPAYYFSGTAASNSGVSGAVTLDRPKPSSRGLGFLYATVYASNLLGSSSYQGGDSLVKLEWSPEGQNVWTTVAAGTPRHRSTSGPHVLSGVISGLPGGNIDIRLSCNFWGDGGSMTSSAYTDSITLMEI